MKQTLSVDSLRQRLQKKSTYMPPLEDILKILKAAAKREQLPCAVHTSDNSGKTY